MESFKEFLVFPLDYQTKVAFLSVDNADKSFTIDVDWNFPVNNEKPKMFLEATQNDEESKQNNNNEQKETEKSIHNIAVSETNSLLAFTTNEKSLFLCKIEGSSCKTLSRRIFLRTTSCIRFCGTSLYVADKTGDVFEYKCDMGNFDRPGTWIFGHISQILDLQVSLNQKYVLTCDRDEKIRVTNSPAYHDIETFCLGHKQFVSSLVILSENLLLSCSGDKTVRLWHFTTGQLLHNIEMTCTPIIMKHRSKSPFEGYLCISTLEHAVQLYSYQLTDESSIKIDLLGEKQYTSDTEITAKEGSFYVEYIEEGKLLIDKISDTSSFDKLYGDTLPDILSHKQSNFKIFKSFEVSILFKNCGKYDNVKEYIDRKKARIESQAMKKK